MINLHLGSGETSRGETHVMDGRLKLASPGQIACIW
eukprot:COSAG04_NODE_30363_length_263_cov_0.628049_1_plen_35_part_01